METDGVTVRCPGCGAPRTIALAVGQQIRCGVCQTMFCAPVVDSEDFDTFSPTSSPMGAAADGLFETPGARQADAAITRTQAWKTGEFERVSTRALRPDADTAPGAVHDLEDGRRQATGLAPDADFPPESATSGGAWKLLVILASTVTLGTCLGVAVITLQGRHDGHQTETDTADAAASPESPATQDDAVHWTDASQSAQRRRQLTVRIERVSYGAPRVKDLNNQVMTTDDANLLAVMISVRNQGSEPRPFHCWYDHTFETTDGTRVYVRLSDDQGRTYAPVRFDDVSHVEGQRWSDQIAPNNTVQDTLLFAMPTDLDRASVRFFRLALPAAAVELTDFFRFEIPAHMIEGFN
ncbi:MAG: DUF4352 domain-containing protein [Planctomycetes bacterium]|nr:DUF4352 domain-containing protein [Planctomycetota bacterium]